MELFHPLLQGRKSPLDIKDANELKLKLERGPGSEQVLTVHLWPVTMDDL